MTNRAGMRASQAVSRYRIGPAGLILAGTFASLALAVGTILQQARFAVACGTALAMFVPPSLTALVRNRTWWPGHAGRAR